MKKVQKHETGLMDLMRWICSTAVVAWMGGCLENEDIRSIMRSASASTYSWRTHNMEAQSKRSVAVNVSGDVHRLWEETCRGK